MRLICSSIIAVCLFDQVNTQNAPASKLLFDDPVYHGAANPVIVPGKDKPAGKNSFEDKRSVIQLAELTYINGEITCDRDQPVTIKLKTK